MTSRLLAGPVLVLQGRELLAVDWLVAHGVQALRQRDEAALAPQLRDLVHHIELAASYARQSSLAAPGQRLAASALKAASSEVGIGADAPAGRPGRLTTRQVAAALGRSVRHVTRHAGVLGGVKVGQDWTFDPEVVTAYGAEREK